MSDVKKFWTVERAAEKYPYSKYETYEEAELKARTRAYESGDDYAVMGLVSVAKAPLEINTIQVEKVS